jgi:hypothetical protein
MTSYDRMCKDAHNTRRRYNISASFSVWILLAGFLVFPGTFTSLQKAAVSNEAGLTGQVIRDTVRIPLICFAGICCVIGTGGICIVLKANYQNYEWLMNHIIE